MNRWIKSYPGESRGNYIFLIFCLIFFATSCADGSMQEPQEEEKEKIEGVDYFLPHIDLNHWKVTLPVGDPTEVEPPEILEYAKNATLLPYMYNDSTDGALDFYTVPDQSTANSKYSRTELREQMEPGSNEVNWTFKKGGNMKGKLKVADISKDASGKYHRTIIMQIHGRLSNDQKALIGADDNDAPPMLKIYWQNEKVRVVTKELKDPTSNDINYILSKDSWTDDEGYYFNTLVGSGEFTLEVIASDGRLEVKLNDAESVVYENVHMEKWSIFENYFKAGNYFQSLDNSSFAKVKYYSLEVSHTTGP